MPRHKTGTVTGKTPGRFAIQVPVINYSTSAPIKKLPEERQLFYWYDKSYDLLFNMAVVTLGWRTFCLHLGVAVLAQTMADILPLA